MSYFEVNDPVLQDAIDYINEYCIDEFGEPAIDDEDPNFRDIGLLYTFAGDNDEVVFEVSVDLDNCTMKCFVNGELRDTTQYDDLQDMIDTDLSSLSFDALYHWCFTNTTDEDFDDDIDEDFDEEE